MTLSNFQSKILKYSVVFTTSAIFQNFKKKKFLKKTLDNNISAFLENQYRPILSIMSYYITIIIGQLSFDSTSLIFHPNKQFYQSCVISTIIIIIRPILSFASTSLRSFIPNKQFYQSCHYYNQNNNNNNNSNNNKFLHHPSFHHYVQLFFFFFAY